MIAVFGRLKDPANLDYFRETGFTGDDGVGPLPHQVEKVNKSCFRQKCYQYSIFLAPLVRGQ
jgi:hypothetical protein